jgi:hypothetical protein
MLAFEPISIQQQVYFLQSRLLVLFDHLFQDNHTTVSLTLPTIILPHPLPQPKVFLLYSLQLLLIILPRLIHILQVELIILCLPVLTFVHTTLVLYLRNRLLSCFTHWHLNWPWRTHQYLRLARRTAFASHKMNRRCVGDLRRRCRA